MGETRWVAMADPYCDEILPGRLPVETFFETDAVVAFHHPCPSFDPVHLLVITKEHVESLDELDDPDLAAEIMQVLAIVTRRVRTEHGACRVQTNIGDYQHSKHLHWHVIVDDRLVAFPPDETGPHHRRDTPAARQWIAYWSRHD